MFKHFWGRRKLWCSLDASQIFLYCFHGYGISISATWNRLLSTPRCRMKMLRGKLLNHMCNTLTTSCPVKNGLNCGSLPKASKCIEPFFFSWLILFGVIELDFWENSLPPLSRQSFLHFREFTNPTHTNRMSHPGGVWAAVSGKAVKQLL